MNIIMLALLVLVTIIIVPTIIYLWIKWYYNELDRLINYKYETRYCYIVANSIATILLFAVCICISWLILVRYNDSDYLLGQIFTLIFCIVLDIVAIVTSYYFAESEDELTEYRNSLIYIAQFICIIPISMYLLVSKLVKFTNDRCRDSSNEHKSIAEQLNEDINDGYNI